MIDFHTHILPVIDDGSRDIDETLLMLKEAKDAGFDKIICTPHYREEFYQVEIRRKIELFDAVYDFAKQEVPELELYIGNEIMATGSVIRLLETLKASTISGTRYVLFELPMNCNPTNFGNIVYEMRSKGLIPVLAHPERYFFVQHHPGLIYEWIKLGVLMQQNFGSIIGQYGKRAKMIAKKMLKSNSVHFFGSDVHRPNTVYKNMPKSMKKLKRLVGQDELWRLTVTNPSMALKDQEIEIKEPKRMKLNELDKLLIKLT